MNNNSPDSDVSLILLSGNPGTGKTSVANQLHQKYGYKVIHVGDLVLENHLYQATDEARDTKIVDEEKINHHLSNLLEGEEGIFICEVHYADILDHPNIDLAIVLRTHPDTIIDRLKPRNYSTAKLKENAEAEFLGDCTSFMLEREDLLDRKKIFEIDTTRISIAEVATLIDQIIKTPEKFDRFQVGQISWLSDETVSIDKFLRP